MHKLHNCHTTPWQREVVGRWSGQRGNKMWAHIIVGAPGRWDNKTGSYYNSEVVKIPHTQDTVVATCHVIIDKEIFRSLSQFPPKQVLFTGQSLS
jgi:hypothetical protein